MVALVSRVYSSFKRVKVMGKKGKTNLKHASKQKQIILDPQTKQNTSFEASIQCFRDTHSHKQVITEISTLRKQNTTLKLQLTASTKHTDKRLVIDIQSVQKAGAGEGQQLASPNRGTNPISPQHLLLGQQ